MNQYANFLSRINIRSVFFNFRYLPFKVAIKIPILVSRKVYLKKIRGSVTIEKPIKTGMIQIGYGDVGIFDKRLSRSIWQISGSVCFKGKAHIGHGSKISVGKNGTLIFGSNFILTAETAIVCHKKITFQNNCLISWETQIIDTDFHKIMNEEGRIINEPESILVGENVWIGSRCTILKGSNIPSNSIIGANTLINKNSCSKSGLYVGVPAKFKLGKQSWQI